MHPTDTRWPTRRAGAILAATLLLFLASPARAAVVFSYPPSPSGGLSASSWVDSQGSDSDIYAYEEFTLDATTAIEEVDWRGGYIYNALYGVVFDFTVTFFDSIAGGSEPHVGNPQLEDTIHTYLVKHRVHGNAGETAAGTFGGTAMYDYHFVLPTPFVAVAGTKYWVRIEASQPVYPDWGIAVGTGGNGSHFQFSTGAAMFSFASHDTSFALLASGVPVTTSTTTSTSSSISTTTAPTTTTTSTSSTSSTTIPIGCGTIPASGCQPAAPAKAKLQLGKGKLSWQWTGNAAVALNEFGNPPATTDYRLCVFVGAGAIVDAAAPAGGICGTKACWKAVKTGFTYKSKASTPNGLTKIGLKAGDVGKAKIQVKAGPPNLLFPALPIALPTRVQLQRSDTGACWEATYGAAKTNTKTTFKATSD